MSDTPDTELDAKGCRQRASQLTGIQRQKRGTVNGRNAEGKRVELPGPYQRTPENEGRAARILFLRRRGAKLEAREPIAA